MDLKIQILPLEDVRTIYRERLVHDFLPEEVKPLSVIEAAIGRQQYVCYGLWAGEEMPAYAFFVVNGPCALLDYYAVRADLRGQGYGSRFLRMLAAETMRKYDCVLLEAENPDFAENARERENMERRLRFYRHNGIRDTGLRAEVWHVEYRILTAPGQQERLDMDPEGCYALLQRTVWPEEVCREKVHIHSGGDGRSPAVPGKRQVPAFDRRREDVVLPDLPAADGEGGRT